MQDIISTINTKFAQLFNAVENLKRQEQTTAQGIAGKNYLQNSNFVFWQRNAGTLAVGAGILFGADRWNAQNNAGGTITVSRQAFTPGQTDVPGEPRYYMRWAQTVAGSAAGGRLAQPIEDVRSLAGQVVCLSFWAKADANGRTITPSLRQNYDNGGGFADLTFSAVTLTNAWARYSVTGTLGSLAGITPGVNSTLTLYLTLATNLTQTIDIANAKLEPGYYATRYIAPDYTAELEILRRYCEKSFAVDTAPATNAGPANAECRILGKAGAVNQALGTISYLVTKRTVPVAATANDITFYNPSAANNFARNSTIGALGDCTATAYGGLVTKERNIFLSVTPPAASAVGDTIQVHWLFDADYYV